MDFRGGPLMKGDFGGLGAQHPGKYLTAAPFKLLEKMGNALSGTFNRPSVRPFGSLFTHIFNSKLGN